jgi:1,4-dihydroxy-2-naphthoate octaprenyltransferase
MAYAFAWKTGVPLSTVAVRLLELLLAGIACGAYASVFNDYTDIDEDRLAGKHTAMMSVPPSVRGVIIGGANFAVFAVLALLLWQGLVISAGCCFLIWVVYTLYSLNPVRLKTRGAWGVGCIAGGEHLLAGLLGAFLVTERVSASSSTFGLTPGFPWLWLLAWSVCSFGWGIRSIVWHQLGDFENDRISNTNTLVTQFGKERTRRAVECVVFPLELISLAAILILGGNALSWAFLALYSIMDWIRWRRLGLSMIVVAPSPNFRFVMLEYYQLFLPLSFLLTDALTSTQGWLFIALQLAVFPTPVRIFLNDVRSAVLPGMRQKPSLLPLPKQPVEIS